MLRWGAVLLALTLGALGVMSWLLYDQQRQLDEVQAELSHTQADLAELSDSQAELADDVRESLVTVAGKLQDATRDLDELESTLFGVAGTPPYQSAMLDDLERDIEEVRACVNDLRRGLQLEFVRVPVADC